MKRIVICADGTWNTRDQVAPGFDVRQPTNVTKVARAVRLRAMKGVQQIVFYQDGVGTRNWLDKYSGGAFGDGIEDNVLTLYRFLVYNYEPGDELYFFGFSRGAFAVRTLAGFMYRCGLVSKEMDRWVPEAYKVYQSKGPGSPEFEKFAVFETRPCPPIRFVGVWDTVGSLGPPGWIGRLVNRDRYKYHFIDLSPAIENAYQALAIDEQRKAFIPDIWHRPPDWTGNLEQAWFAGVHTGIGGGDVPDGLANESLHWLVEKAERLGLEFDESSINHFLAAFNNVFTDSMVGMWKLMGRRRRGIGDHLADGEVVHQSALDRLEFKVQGYAPRNLIDGLATGIRVVDTTRIQRMAAPVL